MELMGVNAVRNEGILRMRDSVEPSNELNHWVKVSLLCSKH